jgi:hypothetical protein
MVLHRQHLGALTRWAGIRVVITKVDVAVEMVSIVIATMLI